MPGTRLSSIEKSIIKQWGNIKAFHLPRLSLISVYSSTGIRGIKNLTINLEQPITAICGRGGSGKSTLLSLCRLSFDNSSDIESEQPSFDDLFLTTHLDAPFTDFEITWKYNNHKTEEVKFQGISRCLIGSKPTKPVWFISLSRSIISQDYNFIANHFKNNPVFNSTIPLTEDYKKRLSDILGKPFFEAALNVSSAVKIRTCLSGNKYSSLNMSLGEDVLIEMLYLLQAAEPESLVLIEDVESGLHPSAITKLTSHLIEICYKKRLQLIVTTRSIDFIDALPREFRYLIEFNGSSHQLHKNVPTNKIIHSISSVLEPDLITDIIIFCEDSIAEMLIRIAVTGELRRRLKIVCAGAKSKLANFAEAHIVSGWSHKVLIVWDGDVTPGETAKWMRSLDMPEEERDAKISRAKLPGLLPPERWILEQLSCNEGFELLANELGEEKSHAEFLVSSLKTLFQHHNVFGEFADKTRLDERTVSTALVRAVARLSSNPLASLRNYIERVSNGDIVIEI